MTEAAVPPVDLSEQWRAEEAAIRKTMGPPGVIDQATLKSMSGMELFAAMRRGELPGPMIGNFMHSVVVDIEPGRIVFQGTPGLEHFNPLGIVHGGFAATMLDSCVGCAIHTTLPAGTGFTTLELKVNYLRAMTDKTGPVRAEGKIITVGRQTAVAEGRITDSRGKLLAFATTTCLVFPLP